VRDSRIEVGKKHKGYDGMRCERLGDIKTGLDEI
jgi:hypothetical protein